MMERLLSAKDGEISSLKGEVRYLRKKVDWLLEIVGEKG